VVSTSVSYLGNAGLKSLPGDRVSSVRLFRDFPECLQPKAAIFSKGSSVQDEFTARWVLTARLSRVWVTLWALLPAPGFVHLHGINSYKGGMIPLSVSPFSVRLYRSQRLLAVRSCLHSSPGRRRTGLPIGRLHVLSRVQHVAGLQCQYRLGNVLMA
jgi:hypothetical protein